MNLVERFQAYADAFEQAYASDDWSALDPYFTDDAVYETIAEPPFGNRIQGREVLKAHFQAMVGGFDRRFDSRTVEVVGQPVERDGSVWFRWIATYTLAGAPALRMDGEETLLFEGNRIQRLEDRIPSTSAAQTLQYMAEHADKLKPVKS